MYIAVPTKIAFPFLRESFTDSSMYGKCDRTSWNFFTYPLNCKYKHGKMYALSSTAALDFKIEELTLQFLKKTVYNYE